jgi:NAD(P)-dependent dehydrogenase (short-subunit alcohol dehydrogenase family)
MRSSLASRRKKFMSILDGKLAIVTQASSELVYAFATELGHAGARLIIADADGAIAEQVAATLKAQGLMAVSCQVGLSTREIRAALDDISVPYGQPAILVNLPFVGKGPVPSAVVDEADFRHLVEANLIHMFLWCQAVGRLMLESGTGGVIANVTTLSAMGGWPGWLAQSAALGGVHNLTHTLAAEWSNRGIRVNGLVYGVTELMMQQIEQTLPGTVLKRIPLGRVVTAEDVARALLYLIHPAASYVSGEILRVDGGWDSWGRLYAVAPKER